jgi:hypothetical protein
MKITLDRRDNEILFFMEAENMEEADTVLTLCQKQLSPNSGRAWHVVGKFGGWIRMPLSKVEIKSVFSGKQ